MHKQKLWGVLFGVMMLLAFLMSAAAPFVPSWWLPKNVSSFGGEIDNLFRLILYITTFFFILTEVILVWAMIKYAGEPGRKVPYVHGNHQLELVWTLIPAGILLFIALWQVKVWAEVKYATNMPKPDATTQQLGVTARQWEWRIRYPSPERMRAWEQNPEGAKEYSAALQRVAEVNKAGDAEHPVETMVYREYGFLDDVIVPNEVHVYKGGKVLIHLRTRDVLHSFFLPQARLKQDALPGKVIPVWFSPTEANTRKVGDRWVDGYSPAGAQDGDYVWELACAEFCGDRHTYMRGKLFVHETRDDFLAWLEQAQKEQQARKVD